MNKKASILRELFTCSGILRIAGAHNGLGAKLIQKNGFEGVWASGLEISTANGVPDANILTMTENLNASIVINEATSLPVVCDCDTGYGNASNVIRMVKKYDAAGLAAVVIEDKLFPKINSFVSGRQELVSIEEFVGKIEAAKSAQISEDFMVFARVEALIAGWGLEEALKRAEAYAEAGADAIVIHSKATTPDEIFAFSKRWKSACPLVVIPTTFYGVTADALAKHGFQMVIYANQGLRASIRAMNDIFQKIISTGSSAAVEADITPMKDVFELQGMLDHKKEEEKFSSRQGIQVVIPAAGRPKIADSNPELNEQPVCMLDIHGKTLLDHQAELLRSCGAREIRVVTGFAADKVFSQGTQKIHNADYTNTGAAYSVMLAVRDLRESCLVVYSDILFDRRLVQQLLTSPHDVTIVMDRAYPSLPPRDKKLDLVVARDTTVDRRARDLRLNTFKPIQKIGRLLDPKEAGHEFVGIVLFREKGLGWLVEAWEKAKIEFKGRPFYESPSAPEADLNDLLQYLVDLKHPIYGFEISHGWSEIHSLEDYRRVLSFYKAEEAVSTLSTDSSSRQRRL